MDNTLSQARIKLTYTTKELLVTLSNKFWQKIFTKQKLFLPPVISVRW